MEYTSDYRLTLTPTDVELQDTCDVIRQRFERLLSATPEATIMIAAHNEELYLPVMLEQLSKLQTIVPLEIIAVDNASNDRTGAIIKESGVTLITENKKGVSYARQAGLENSHGKYVFSTDADTQVPEGWIDANLKYFQENPNLVCFTAGSVPNGGHISYWVLRSILVNLRKIMNTQVSGTWTFPGHNMVYLREAAQSIGGYQLGTDLGEDNILARKLRLKGDILRVDDIDAQVSTSARRVSTFARVAQISAARVRDYGVNFLNYDKVNAVGKTFSDIR